MTQTALTALLLLAIGYLLGAIPSGYLAGRWLKGIDLRECGSGSTGATNVLRNVGKGPALAVFLIDVGKGALAVLLAKSFGLSDWLQVLAGLAALAGHIWPVWLGWKGGKAVATGLGMFLGLAWPVGLACFGLFMAVISIFRIVSLSSVVAAIGLPLLMLISGGSSAYVVVSLVASLMVLWRHHLCARVKIGTHTSISLEQINIHGIRQIKSIPEFIVLNRIAKNLIGRLDIQNRASDINSRGGLPMP